MTCPDCEYHKRRAQIWRHQAYKLGGKPLPWEPNMTDLRKVAEMALNVLLDPKSRADECADAVQTLRQALDYPTPKQIALAQQIRPKGKSRIGQALAQEQEPVAWMWKDGSLTTDPYEADGTWTKLYTAPPKREWVGLTDEEMKKTWYETKNIMGWYSFEEIARLVETKLKEKNT